jgi:hypothetical protein
MLNESRRHEAEVRWGETIVFCACVMEMILLLSSPASYSQTKSFRSDEVTALVTVTIQTNFSGDSVIVDGIKYLGPITRSWESGSVHTIGTDSIQKKSDGVRDIFRSWSDGGFASHTVTVSGNATFTANFVIQYYLTMNGAVSGHAAVSPYSNWFIKDTTITISAGVQSGDAYFAQWVGAGTGSYTGPNNPASIVMNGPMTETATFTYCSYTISPTQGSFTASGGRKTFGVSTNGACGWFVQGSVSWIHVIGLGGRTGSGPFDYSVDPNPNPITRSTTLYVMTGSPPTPHATYQVSQSGSFYVTLQTTLGGDSIIVDGVKYISPVIQSWLVGSVHSIGIDSIQNSTVGERHLYHSWSDGGILTHPVTVSSDTLLTANGVNQFYLALSAYNPHPPTTSGWYNEGASLQIAAINGPGVPPYSFFSHWYGTGPGSYTGPTNPVTITMNGPITETAHYGPTNITIVPDTVSVKLAGDTLRFVISSNPPGAPWVSESASSWIIALKSMGLDRDTAQYLVLPASDTTARTGSIKFSSIIYTGYQSVIVNQNSWTDASKVILGQGWNLVSVPRVQLNDDAAVIFPTKYGSMFRYNPISGGYEEATTLVLGVGYWIYYFSSTVIIINGDAPGPISIACRTGWNLIGSCEEVIEVSSLTTDHGAVIFGDAFRYDPTSGSYHATPTINPGEAVWIYVTGECMLTVP